MLMLTFEKKQNKIVLLWESPLPKTEQNCSVVGIPFPKTKQISSVMRIPIPKNRTKLFYHGHPHSQKQNKIDLLRESHSQKQQICSVMGIPILKNNKFVLFLANVSISIVLMLI